MCAQRKSLKDNHGATNHFLRISTLGSLSYRWINCIFQNVGLFSLGLFSFVIPEFLVKFFFFFLFNMFLLCWEILKKCLQSTCEWGILWDKIGSTSSPHLNTGLQKRRSRNLYSDNRVPRKKGILEIERKACSQNHLSLTWTFFILGSFRELASYSTKEPLTAVR